MSEIENLKSTIATLQQQLEKLEAEQKAKKWEPKAGPLIKRLYSRLLD